MKRPTDPRDAPGASPTECIELAAQQIQESRAPEAVALLRRATTAWPEAWQLREALGDALLAARRDEEAIGAFLAAVQLNPHSGEACVKIAQSYFSRGLDAAGAQWIRHAMQIDDDPTRHAGVLAAAEARCGHRESAIRLCEAWVAAAPENPERRHLAAAITGVVPPPRAAVSYVKRLFDGYSKHFDESLARLEYRGPELTLAALEPVPENAAWHVLDLGCGTGLVGQLLKPHCERLVGIDLSTRMLEISAERNVYDELLECDVEAYLANCRQEFDVIAGADVLTYIGDLSDFFPAAAGALRPGGRLVLVLEEAPHDPEHPGYRLNMSGRYAHQWSYIEQGLAEAGLSARICRGESMRLENGRPTPTLAVCGVQATDVSSPGS